MDKRKAIMESALKLFAENGFHATPTARIAKEAGVANGTLFQHFPTKEKLVADLFVLVKEELEAVLANHPTDFSTEQKFQWYFSQSILWALQNRDKFNYIQQFYNSTYIFLLQQSELKKYTEAHLLLIQQGIKEGMIKDLNTELIYQLFTSQVFGTVQYLTTQPTPEPQKAIAETFDLLWLMLKK